VSHFFGVLPQLLQANKQGIKKIDNQIHEIKRDAALREGKTKNSHSLKRFLEARGFSRSLDVLIDSVVDPHHLDADPDPACLF
jgi:hypothetical protein